MTTNDIRQKYLDFFKARGHAVIPSAPLVPADDPTVLFTTAGMHPLVPYLTGQPHPAGKRLVDFQECVRTGDIDEVGDSSHLTHLEMLGNWSLGDYFKAEAIQWSFEFLTTELGIDPHRLFVTVYEGDDLVPKDEESIADWQKQFKAVGIEAKVGERIFALNRDHNWWGPAGQTGPCGPDTEMYYFRGNLGELEPGSYSPESDSRFVEIWNDVFMAYHKNADGSYSELKQRNVDTGMGLDRMAAVLQGLDSVYDTDLMKPIKTAVEQLALASSDLVYQASNKSHLRSIRIITDHLRAATFILADGVTPSNTERGYVLRRIIRRAIRQGLYLGLRQNFTAQIAQVVVDQYQSVYPELKTLNLSELETEETLFRKTLERGVREFTKLVSDKLTGQLVFVLFDTFGFPPELSIEDATRLHIPIDPIWQTDFDQLMTEQKDRSRTATAGVFKGGLADHSEATTKYHTATHLMHQALRRVLGTHVIQRGSNITPERLRFDFSHTDKMTPEEINQVEVLVNAQIDKDLPVSWTEMSTTEAFKSGALGAFGDKYGDVVKVYTVGDPKGEWFSREICGGPHVEHTGQLGADGKKFKIKKEESSSAGVRRVKAVLE